MGKKSKTYTVQAPEVRTDPALESRISALEGMLNQERQSRAASEESFRNREASWQQSLIEATSRSNAPTEAALGEARGTIAAQTAALASMTSTVQGLQSQASASAEAARRAAEVAGSRQDPADDVPVTDLDAQSAAAMETLRKRVADQKARKTRGALLIPMGGGGGTGLSIPT